MILIINVYHHVLKLKINNYINMLFLKLITVLKRHVINYQIRITNIIITILMKTKYNVLLHVMKTLSTFKKITVLSNVLVIMFMHLIIVIQFVTKNANTLLKTIRRPVQKRVTIVKLRILKHQLRKNQFIICYSKMLQIIDYVLYHVVQLKLMNQVKQKHHLFGI